MKIQGKGARKQGLLKEGMIQAWLEWDEGTMRKLGLAAKLHAYAQYLRTRQWRQDEDVLPLLLMVVPDPGQEQPCSV